MLLWSRIYTNEATAGAARRNDNNCQVFCMLSWLYVFVFSVLRHRGTSSRPITMKTHTNFSACNSWDSVMLLLVGINPDTIKLHEAVNPCNELSANDGNRCVVGVGCTGLSLHAFCCSVELCTFTKPRSSYRRKINIQSHLLCEIGHYGIDSSFTSDKKKKQPNGIGFFVLFMLIRH